MKSNSVIFGARRTVLLGCTALVSAFSLAGGASASTAADSASSADSASVGVADIIVTAQKRSQRSQDVPISMTALNTKTLEANRITSVTDLSEAVPNMGSRNVAGGAQLPAFTMRGVTSYGVVPGSDKEISIYIDGVYMGSATGGALDLPDVAQIEVLRGPQGTLFGRNATAGAVSVTTRDPASKFGIGQDFTYGNYNEFRSKTRVDFGTYGDFSASVSFLHDQRDGDIRNSGAGTVWTVPSGLGIPTTYTSPATLGAKNLNSVFVAIKYEPSSDFKVVNKFDWTGDHFTAAGAAPVAFEPSTLGSYAQYLTDILASQDTPPALDTTATRPTSVNNAFTSPSYSKSLGDSLTAQYRINNNWSIKNILAYRETYVHAAEQMDGIGGLSVTQALVDLYPAMAPVLGSPICAFCIEQISTSKQISDEFQVNYNSKDLTLTAGLLYYHLTTVNGGRPGYPQNIFLQVVPYGNIGYIDLPNSKGDNSAISLAAYAQAEVHVTSQLDLVGGIRETNDNKSGVWHGTSDYAFTYNKSSPTFSLGVNYKPTRDVLLYAKYSTGFVSGGSSADVPFGQETAKSWEAGIKSDWFDHRLRANLAAFDVNYSHLQTAQSGTNVGHSEVALLVVDLGNMHSRGFEFDSTIVPVDGVTLGAALGYTEVNYTYINPAAGLFTNVGGNYVPADLTNFLPTLQPKWTANLSAEYDTPPVFGDARMTFRLDANWHDKELLDGYTNYYTVHQYDVLKYAPAEWNINGRVSLDHIKVGTGEAQLALWVKNLTNGKSPVFMDLMGGALANAEFEAARTFGVDFSFKM